MTAATGAEIQVALDAIFGTNGANLTNLTTAVTNLLQIGKQYATILRHFVGNVTDYSTQFTE